MKYYELNAIVNGEQVKLKKSLFSSRTEAIDYMFHYFDEHYLYSLSVEDEYAINHNKHSIEYVCDFHNRFRVTRLIAA